MKIAISGSSGFVGQQLSNYFINSGNERIVISRSDLISGVNHLAKIIKSADVIIHLAGASVMQRWSRKNKELILSSRIITTRALVEAVKTLAFEHRPSVFISASAIGIYEDGFIHDERSTRLGSNFLSSVCKAWEKETEPLREMEVRHCTIRLGVVLGTTGGALHKMLPLFRLGLGGRLGSGKQPFSFIHINDLCRAVDHLIENKNSAGVYNFVGQYPATNQVMTELLAKRLNRPAFFAVPEWVLSVIYGPAATMLTRGATVLPARLLEEGFIFEFSDLNRALADLIVKQ